MNIILFYIRFLHLKFFPSSPNPIYITLPSLPQWASNLFPAQFLFLIKSQDFSLDLELGDHLDYNHQEKKPGDPPSQPALLPLPTTTQAIYLNYFSAFINLHLL